MSETVERLLIRRSPLEEAQARLGASFAERDGWRVPASYGDPAAEYAFVRDGGAGLIDLSSRGRVEAGGAEAVQFLNGLITNDVKTLADGAWMLAAFPNAQGRLQAFARVLRRGETFLFDTEAVTHERVFKLLERFTLAGDFRVKDVTEQTALLSVQGARAAEIIRAVFGAEAAKVARGHTTVASRREGQSVTLMRATHTGEDGFDLLVDAAQGNALLDALCAAGGRAVGFEALETLRLEAGIPRFGVDMDETNVVLETGQDEAVSFTKGCYIGQEIIARIHWRGHVAKRLAGLIIEDEFEIGRDDKVRSVDGKEIGRVTSVAVSPRLGRTTTIALALLKYDYLLPLTPVRVLHQDREIAASVAALPFVRGSWLETANGQEQDG